MLSRLSMIALIGSAAVVQADGHNTSECSGLDAAVESDVLQAFECLGTFQDRINTLDRQRITAEETLAAMQTALDQTNSRLRALTAIVQDLDQDDGLAKVNNRVNELDLKVEALEQK